MTQEEIEQILEADIQAAIADLWRQLASGEMTPADWRSQMGDLLAQYLTAAWILGEGGEGELLDPDGLRAYIEAQFAFLDNFASQLETAISERRLNGFVGVPGYDGYTIVVNDDGSITIIDANGNEVDGGNVFAGFRTLNGGRAGMYGDAMWGAYQTGKIVQIGAGTKYGLHLPAEPGEGSECRVRCRCHWLIIPINVDEGEYNAFWTLGQAEHCPTCLRRAAEWNPLHIWHGWPDYKVKSIKEKIEEIALKHRQGMHNQKRHGWRFGSLDKARSSMRGQEAGEREAYRKRAGMPVPAKKPKVEGESGGMKAAREYSTYDVRNPSAENFREKMPIMGGNREKLCKEGIATISHVIDKAPFHSSQHEWQWRYIEDKNSRVPPNERVVNSFINTTDSVRGLVKADIVNRLASRGVIDKDAAENIDKWADTSNDTSARALVLQQAAAQAFGVKLSQWQQGKNADAEKEYGMELKPSAKDVAYWKSVYKETQSFFQKAGYKPDDEIILYRGVTKEANKNLKNGNARYEGNAVESWSFDLETAHRFGLSEYWGGVVASAKIKIKDIISTCFTGPGCIPEMEVIVLGSRPNQEVYIYDISE